MQFGPPIVTDGLVFAVDGANKKSYSGTGTVWKDLSGNGFDATLYNNPTYSNQYGGVITFDGTDDYAASTLTGINLDSGCTIECFVKRPTTPTAWRTYFNVKSNTANTPFFEFRTNGASLTALTNYYNGTDYSSTVYNINNTSFYHFLGSYDGAGNIIFYVNGTYYATTTSVPTFSIGNSPRVTIARAYSEDRPTNIIMGICRVYNRYLSATDVLQNYNATKSRFGL